MAASTSIKKLGFRRTEKFFLIIGLIGSILFGVWWLTSNRLESYQSWRFDQALQGRRSSWIAYVDYVTFSIWKRIVLEPTIGSPRVPIVEVPKAETKAEEVAIPEKVLIPEIGSTIGRLHIPSIDLSVVVLNGTDEWVLNQAVGRIEGTALPGQDGNIGIAGHRDRQFRVLRKIRQGDEITLTTTQGTYRYKVADTEIVNPSDTSVLNRSAQPCLTLVTCYPFYYVGHAPKRFVVKANLDSDSYAKPGTQ